MLVMLYHMKRRGFEEDIKCVNGKWALWLLEYCASITPLVFDSFFGPKCTIEQVFLAARILTLSGPKPCQLDQLTLCNGSLLGTIIIVSIRDGHGMDRRLL